MVGLEGEQTASKGAPTTPPPLLCASSSPHFLPAVQSPPKTIKAALASGRRHLFWPASCVVRLANPALAGTGELWPRVGFPLSSSFASSRPWRPGAFLSPPFAAGWSTVQLNRSQGK